MILQPLYLQNKISYTDKHIYIESVPRWLFWLTCLSMPKALWNHPIVWETAPEVL